MLLENVGEFSAGECSAPKRSEWIYEVGPGVCDNDEEENERSGEE